MVENETMMFKLDKDRAKEVREILEVIHRALSEKGYNPINQIVGYIMSGDPTYITSHQNARSIIGKLERDEILEEVIRFYLDKGV
ncbi:MAG: IreB family regulatory phosphoprotein [Clostridiales bacterium]|nr:IreB family regulatory phosphoprotein [Clostridiales bacterium]